MKNFNFKTPGKIPLFLMIIFILCFQGTGSEPSAADSGENQEQEVKKAKLYKDIYPLISESDSTVLFLF